MVQNTQESKCKNWAICSFTSAVHLFARTLCCGRAFVHLLTTHGKLNKIMGHQALLNHSALARVAPTRGRERAPSLHPNDSSRKEERPKIVFHGWWLARSPAAVVSRNRKKKECSGSEEEPRYIKPQKSRVAAKMAENDRARASLRRMSACRCARRLL